MLAGEVAMVNDHKLVVDTDQGHSVSVEMDSRTLIPSDLQSGMGVRVEYKTMENGTKLATRVVPLRDYERNEREMAYNENEEYEENEAMPANNVEMSSTMADNEPRENEQAENAGNEHATANQSEESGEHQLPKTASNQPLIALLGLAALAAAGALATRRHLRIG
jgi:LPXTG-motif cell wall-anchored protein